MSLRSRGVMKVLCNDSTTAGVMSSHSCSMCATRCDWASRSAGLSMRASRARHPSTVFAPCCSKNWKKVWSWGRSRMAGAAGQSASNIAGKEARDPFEGSRAFPRRMAARLLRWMGETAVQLYFPRRTVAGAENLPPPGGAIYVANHPNGLLDPMALRVTLKRPARFLAKSTLWENPNRHQTMEAFACLPLFRIRDAAETGPIDTVARNEQTFARCRAALATGDDL